MPQSQYMRALKQRYYACVTTLYVTLHKQLSLSLRNFFVDGISLLSSVSSNEPHTTQLLGRISTHGLDFCREHAEESIFHSKYPSNNAP